MSEDFALKICAGPDYQHLKIISANDCKNPIFVNGPHFTGFISVKVRDFSGITPGLEALKESRKNAKETKARVQESVAEDDGEFYDAEDGEEETEQATKEISEKLAATTIYPEDASHLPIPKPSFPYFEGKNRRYSMMIQGRFKQQYNADEIVFGGDFDAPMVPPPGTGLIMKVNLSVIIDCEMARPGD